MKVETAKNIVMALLVISQVILVIMLASSQARTRSHIQLVSGQVDRYAKKTDALIAELMELHPEQKRKLVKIINMPNR